MKNNTIKETTIHHLPSEILIVIFKYVGLKDIDNCSMTCQYWKKLLAEVLMKPRLNRLIKSNLTLKKKLIANGWKKNCHDYDMIRKLHKKFKYYNLKHPAPLPITPIYVSELVTAPCPPKPTLKISRLSPREIVLAWGFNQEWKITETEAQIQYYQIYGYQEKFSQSVESSLWCKIGDISPLELPMACTIIDSKKPSTKSRKPRKQQLKYHFAIRARDYYGRFGQFSEPCSTF